MKIVNIELQLPNDLPPGERVLWFGRPSVVGLWRRAYRADFVALYFAGLTLWAGVDGTQNSVLAAFITGGASLGLLALLALVNSKTTMYVITNRRVVIKVGAALTVFHNLPFNQIQSAGLRAFGDGTGDVSMKPAAGQRVSYWSLWPCARPLRFRDPEPTLRAVSQAREVARVLTRAMIEANGGQARARAPERAKASALTTPATI
jgi:hypothetical protein